jgi:FlaG/FlaF family flagellin (archaellin)
MIQKLNFDSDERGVSEVLGAILVFGILVVLLGIIQTQAVPAQNQEVEFQHNLDVQGDLIEFQQTASDVTADGNERSVTFKSGTGYPSRLLFFNPPRVQGTVETSEQAEVTLENVEATNDEVNNYFEDTNNGPGGNTLTLDTRRLQYRVNYNELPSEPVSRYEYGFLYNYFEDEDEYIVQNNGNVIDGTTINLRFLAGDYSKTSGSEQSLNVQPVSAPARSVRVTGTAGNNIFITLPTALDINVWQNEYGGAVAGITPGPGDTVRIELDGSQTYNLRMSALALESGVDEPGPYYIVPTRDGVTNAAPSETASIQYEVRDEYNNPVADAEVEITDPNGVVASGTTDDEGRFSTTVTTAESKQFTAELVGASATEAECSQATDSRCEADFLVQVPALNLNPSAGVQLSDATTQDPDPNTRTGTGGAVDCTLVSCKADVTFENTNSQEVGMDLLRVNHYNPDPQGHTDVDVSIGSSMITAEIGGASVDATPLRNIPATSSETYTFTFQGEVHEGDYFVVTIIYDNNERALYFISPKD